MIKYVVGFMFDTSGNSVVLIKKNKPAYMKGKLNGVGGKVEPGENSHQAMVREFEEETGVRTRLHDWHLYSTLVGENHFIDIFYAMDTKYTFQARTVEEEEVDVYYVKDVMKRAGFYNADSDLVETMPNIKWMIPMALSMRRGEGAIHFRIDETYPTAVELPKAA